MSFFRLFTITLFLFFMGINILFLYFVFGGQKLGFIFLIGTIDIIVGLSLWVLMRKGIILPLRELKEALGKAGKGDFGKRIPSSFFQETHDLAETTNEMIARMQEREKDVEEAQATLEIRIRARTRELQEMTEGLEEKVRQRTEELQGKIAELEEAQKRSERERRKTDAIIVNFSDGLVVFDEHARVEFINPAAEKILLVKKEKVLQKDIKELKRISQLTQEVRRGEETSRKEIELSDGRTFGTATIPFDLPGGRKGVMVILHDITQEKRVENLKSEFVSLAAHQLRTPLSAVKWTIGLLLEGDLGKLTKQQHDFVQKTREANEQMIELVNDLLNVARIEEGRYVYKPKLMSLEDIVAPMIESYKERAKQKRITFTYKHPDQKGPQILVDEEKIRIAAENIIENALRYTLEGGKVTVTLNNNTEQIELSVKDTGIGVSVEERKRIFEKFFRGKTARKVDTHGTGLGLYLAKNIIEAHGGTIQFESKEKSGTTVSFFLPVGKGAGKKETVPMPD